MRRKKVIETFPRMLEMLQIASFGSDVSRFSDGKSFQSEKEKLFTWKARRETSCFQSVSIFNENVLSVKCQTPGRRPNLIPIRGNYRGTVTIGVVMYVRVDKRPVVKCQIKLKLNSLNWLRFCLIFRVTLKDVERKRKCFSILIRISFLASDLHFIYKWQLQI